ncbi:DNA repair exonuclease [Tissierella pigra]|uniref:DNA repair exonuclease n=1 Tax=Tissierella pigra TaxID=2607614 RepID=A0A6N7XFN5_9FIRM|nr:DNA repair exonuclease [Tissierella pigra]MBU5426080.1 DNA repair exonuclease [Tissierella pigra]MSU00799.1 DNA repair exonuclease [Tissierella pigra]
MVRFIHTGDLHLGLKFRNVSFEKEKAAERRRELWTTFERIVQYGKDNKVDFLLIAGDLFEEAYFTISDITRIRDTFRNAENINIIISAGNHDYRGRKSLYDKIEWTENVTIFNGSKIQNKEFKDLNTVIYGYSWDTVEIKENNLFSEITVDTTKNNILVLHGDLGHGSTYLPLKIGELNRLNMDYIALGHIHKPQIISKNIAYSGCPEPLDFGEIGERGIIEGVIENKETKIKLTPFSKRKFMETNITINEDMGYIDILESIRNLDIGNKSMDFFRINLSGFLRKDLEIKNLEKDLYNDFYHLEIIDNTIWDYNLDELEEENKYNIIGKFINTMKDKGLDDPVVKDALYTGLEVLLKGR